MSQLTPEFACYFPGLFLKDAEVYEIYNLTYDPTRGSWKVNSRLASSDPNGCRAAGTATIRANPKDRSTLILEYFVRLEGVWEIHPGTDRIETQDAFQQHMQSGLIHSDHAKDLKDYLKDLLPHSGIQ